MEGWIGRVESISGFRAGGIAGVDRVARIGKILARNLAKDSGCRLGSCRSGIVFVFVCRSIGGGCRGVGAGARHKGRRSKSS